MKKKSLIVAAIALLAVSLAVSCNKDDETTTLPYLGGTVWFDLPPFGRLGGEPITLTAHGAEFPEGNEKYGYYWGSYMKSTADTTDVLKLRMPASRDSLASYTISCSGFAKGYYSTSTSIIITIVDPTLDGSITGTGIKASDPHVTDSRNPAITGDEATYWTANIGSATWFKNNLAYYNGAGPGAPYEDCDVMSAILGRYYTYDEAIAACPSGWHLSTEAEWCALGKTITGRNFNPGEIIEDAAGALMVDASFNGTTLWEYWPAVKITNQTGFCAIPSGYAEVNEHGRKYLGARDYAMFWTATSDPDDAEKAYCRYINVNSPDIFCSSLSKASLACSVRCVKD